MPPREAPAEGTVPVTPKGPSRMERLTALLAVHPQEASCRARIEELAGKVTELEADKEKFAGRAKIVEGIDEEIAALQKEERDIRELLGYMTRKRAQLDRFFHLDDSMREEASALLAQKPETREDRAALRAKRRSLLSASTRVDRAMDIIEAPSDENGAEGPSFEERVRDFFNDAGKDSAEVVPGQRKRYLGRRQIRELATAFGHPSAGEFLRTKEYLTLEEGFRRELERALALTPGMRVFAEQRFAKLLALPTPEERKLEYEALERFLRIAGGLTPSTIGSVLGGSSREEDAQYMLKEWMSPGRNPNRTEFRLFDLLEQYYLSTLDAKDLSVTLPSYAFSRIASEPGSSPLSRKLDAMKHSMRFSSHAGTVVGLSLGTDGRLVGYQGVITDPEVADALMRETRRLMAELVPAMNALPSERRETLRRSAVTLTSLGARVDTANGTIQSTDTDARAQALNGVGALVRAQAEIDERARADRQTALLAREKELNAQIDGTWEHPVLTAETLSAIPDDAPAYPVLRALEEFAKWQLSEVSRLTHNLRTVRDSVYTINGSFEMRQRKEAEIAALEKELGEFGMLRRTSSEGRTKQQVEQKIEEARALIASTPSDTIRTLFQQIGKTESPPVTWETFRSIRDSEERNISEALDRARDAFFAAYEQHDAFRDRYGALVDELSRVFVEIGKRDLVASWSHRPSELRHSVGYTSDDQRMLNELMEEYAKRKKAKPAA